MRIGRSLAVLVVTLGILLAIVAHFGSVPALARQPSARGWRYASLTQGNNGTVEVCYLEVDGCRREVVTVPSIPAPREPMQVNIAAMGEQAFVKAIATLGTRGWEMVGDAPAVYGGGSRRALFFKRLE